MRAFCKLTVAFLFIAGIFCSSAWADKVNVALILPSTIDDMAWGQAMYDGLKAVQERMGDENFELAVSERLWNAVDAGSAIRQYASQGYSLVIAHGAQYQSVLDEVAPDFPETSFAYGTGFNAGAPNIFAYDPHAQEGAYLLGMLAGLTTKTGIIGVVGPVEAGDAIKYNKGFVKGVKASNPDAKVRIAYTGSFGDLVAAGEIAKTHIKAGADILTGSAQQTVGAIKVASTKPGIFWLSTDMDQSSLAPDTVLAAQAYDFSEVVEQMLELRKSGVLGGRHIALSLATGTLDLVWNPELSDSIPEEVVTRIEETKEKIASGTLKVNLD